MQLDHVFVFAPLGAPAADLLVSAGLVEGPPNVHPGQGTANRRFFFTNGMLELLWVHDEAEARSARTAPSKLWERSQWQQRGTSPFGLCWRHVAEVAGHEPFPTYPYRPLYLPEGEAIPTATLSKDPNQPMGFLVPDAFLAGPKRPLPPRSERRIRKLVLRQPRLDPTWRMIAAMDTEGLVVFEDGPVCMELWLEGEGVHADLRPAGVPLMVRSGLGGAGP
jgi:Glyoxalase-like domain